MQQNNYNKSVKKEIIHLPLKVIKMENTLRAIKLDSNQFLYINSLSSVQQHIGINLSAFKNDL